MQVMVPGVEEGQGVWLKIESLVRIHHDPLPPPSNLLPSEGRLFFIAQLVKFRMILQLCRLRLAIKP
jgi:hypothetical protein